MQITEHSDRLVVRSSRGVLRGLLGLVLALVLAMMLLFATPGNQILLFGLMLAVGVFVFLMGYYAEFLTVSLYADGHGIWRRERAYGLLRKTRTFHASQVEHVRAHTAQAINPVGMGMRSVHHTQRQYGGSASLVRPEHGDLLLGWVQQSGDESTGSTLLSRASRVATYLDRPVERTGDTAH